MREIKYQAWLHDEKQMVNVIEINTFNKYIRYYDISHCQDDAEIFDFIRSNLPNADCGFEGCDLRQYTGLKDKNGKDIFEGDILANKKAFNCSFKVIWNPDGAWFVHDKDDWPCYYLRQVNGSTEVIGNVFEHPELLEVEGAEKK